MSEILALPDSFTRMRYRSLIVAIAALILCAIGWAISPIAFFRSYLFAYLFFLGLTLGSMAWVMMHHLVGGGWGRAIQRIAEAAALNIVLMFVLFIPILCGLKWLYPWTDSHRLLRDAILRHKAGYLNTGFFTIRAFIYFAAWIGLALWVVRASARFDRTQSPALALWMRRVSAGGLVLYVLLMSLAGVDWIMSREPHYFSTIFGFILVVGHALTALLFLIIVLTLLVTREPLRSFVTLGHFNDLGNLLLTCVILWAYVAFAQFLISWTGNIQEEVRWYYLRSKGLYGFFAAGLIVLHFLVPFFLLLSKQLKRSPEIIAKLAAALLCIRILDIYWMVAPTGAPVASPNRYWLNIAAPIGIGCLWLSAFLWNLSRMSLLAVSEHQEPSSSAEHHSDPQTGTHGAGHVHPA
jgi:hypothetical protein